MRIQLSKHLLFFFIFLLKPKATKGDKLDLNLKTVKNCFSSFDQTDQKLHIKDGRTCLTAQSDGCGYFSLRDTLYVKNVTFPFSPKFLEANGIVFLGLKNTSTKYCGGDLVCDGPADMIYILWFQPIEMCGIQVNLKTQHSNTKEATPQDLNNDYEQHEIDLHNVHLCENGGPTGDKIIDGEVTLNSSTCAHFLLDNLYYVLRIDIRYANGNLTRCALLDDYDKKTECSVKACEGFADRVELKWSSIGAKIFKILVTTYSALPAGKPASEVEDQFRGSKSMIWSVPLVIVSFAILLLTKLAIYRHEKSTKSVFQLPEFIVDYIQNESKGITEGIKKSKLEKVKNSVPSFQTPVKPQIVKKKLEKKEINEKESSLPSIQDTFEEKNNDMKGVKTKKSKKLKKPKSQKKY